MASFKFWFFRKALKNNVEKPESELISWSKIESDVINDLLKKGYSERDVMMAYGYLKHSKQSITTSLLLKKMDDLELNKTSCVICYEKEIRYAILPCGHYAFCKDCIIKINSFCPICNQKKTSHTIIYPFSV